MNELLQHKYDTLASLYWKPCDFNELCGRDFCKNLPKWYLDSIISRLENDGLIVRQKNGIIKALKRKAKQVLNRHDYEIDD